MHLIKMRIYFLIDENGNLLWVFSDCCNTYPVQTCCTGHHAGCCSLFFFLNPKKTKLAFFFRIVRHPVYIQTYIYIQIV